MPALVTPRLRLLHIARTGGTWAARAMAEAGVKYDRLYMRTGTHGTHADLEQTRAYAGRYTITFVRHPLDCYRSIWGLAQRVGWQQRSPLFEVRSDDFETFMINVLGRFPGMLSRRYVRYTGQSEDAIDFVGRFETLTDDLVRALKESGEPFDESMLRAYPRVNCNDYAQFPASYTRELAERVLASEREIVERWYPEHASVITWIEPRRS